MNLYAGVDSGSWNTKAVVIDADAHVLGAAVVRSAADLAAAAEQAYAAALDRAKCRASDVTAVWATGFGRQAVSFAHGPTNAQSFDSRIDSGPLSHSNSR